MDLQSQELVSAATLKGLITHFNALPKLKNCTETSLNQFIQQLKATEHVCRMITSISSSSNTSASTKFLQSFQKDFLIGAVLPVLNSNIDKEIAMATFYFEIIFVTINHPLLVNCLVDFINGHLSAILLKRILAQNVTITLSTLRLFIAFLDSYNENLWYHFILKYLLPKYHLLQEQRHQVNHINFNESAIKFLAMVPINLIQCIPAEILNNNYLKYSSCESQRLKGIKEELKDAALCTDSNSAVGSSIYPTWKLCYDGTDNVDVDSYNGDSIQNHRQIASYGPFLDNLFVRLSNWPHVDINVILVVTDIIGKLAKSRIPLLHSLLLDMELTFQPAYLPFRSLLTRIKDDIEQQLDSKCTQDILMEIWKEHDNEHFGKNSEDERPSGSQQSCSSRTPVQAPPPAAAAVKKSRPRQPSLSQSSTSWDDELGELLIEGALAFNSKVQSLINIFGQITKTKNLEEQQGNYEQVPQRSDHDQDEIDKAKKAEENAQKLVAVKAICFCHFVFEMAAVSQHLYYRNL